jgi:hypothetical protein
MPLFAHFKKELETVGGKLLSSSKPPSVPLAVRTVGRFPEVDFTAFAKTPVPPPTAVMKLRQDLNGPHSSRGKAGSSAGSTIPFARKEEKERDKELRVFDSLARAGIRLSSLAGWLLEFLCHIRECEDPEAQLKVPLGVISNAYGLLSFCMLQSLSLWGKTAAFSVRCRRESVLSKMKFRDETLADPIRKAPLWSEDLFGGKWEDFMEKAAHQVEFLDKTAPTKEQPQSRPQKGNKRKAFGNSHQQQHNRQKPKPPVAATQQEFKSPLAQVYKETPKTYGGWKAARGSKQGPKQSS